MLTYEIKKPVQQSVIQNIRQSFRDKLDEREKDRFRHNYMDKIEFAIWIEGIKERFPKGTLVTMAAIPYQTDAIPPAVFKVNDIQEIHFMAPMDEYVPKQPKCVIVDSTKYDIQAVYCPKTLRKLTDEEVQLVHLRNKEIEARRAANDGGTLVILDAAGKIVEEG
jgi:hypothetical protein